MRGYKLDLIALVLAAIVLLFPRPGVTVFPALARASTSELDRIAELQSRLSRQPGDLESTLELADLYTAEWRPDWALATLGPLAAAQPGDLRVHLAMVVAFADRFDFPSAKAAIDRARAVCDQAPATRPCSPADRVRIGVFDDSIGAVVAAGASFRKNPNEVREILDRAFHNTKVPGRNRLPAPVRNMRKCTDCHRTFFPRPMSP